MLTCIPIDRGGKYWSNCNLFLKYNVEVVIVYLSTREIEYVNYYK